MIFGHFGSTPSLDKTSHGFFAGVEFYTSPNNVATSNGVLRYVASQNEPLHFIIKFFMSPFFTGGRTNSTMD